MELALRDTQEATGAQREPRSPRQPPKDPSAELKDANPEQGHPKGEGRMKHPSVNLMAET